MIYVFHRIFFKSCHVCFQPLGLSVFNHLHCYCKYTNIVLLLLASSAGLKQKLLKIDDPQQTPSAARVPATQPQLPAAGTPAITVEIGRLDYNTIDLF